MLNFFDRRVGRRLAATPESSDVLEAGRAGPSAAATISIADGRLSYHLFLGRGAESDAAAQALSGLSVEELANAFFSSQEFVERILRPVAREGRPFSWSGHMPPALVDAGLTRTLGLDASAVLQSEAWDERLGCLLQVTAVRRVLSDLHGDLARPLIDAARSGLARLHDAIALQEVAKRTLQARTSGLDVVQFNRRMLAESDGVAASKDRCTLVLCPTLRQSGTDEKWLKLSIAFHGRPEKQFPVIVHLREDAQPRGTLALPSIGAGETVFLIDQRLAFSELDIEIPSLPRDTTLSALRLEAVHNGRALMDQAAPRSSSLGKAFYAKRALRRLQEHGRATAHAPADLIQRSQAFSYSLSGEGWHDDYAAWEALYVCPDADDYAKMSRIMGEWTAKPAFHLLVTVAGAPADQVQECIYAILHQNYARFAIWLLLNRSDDVDALESIPNVRSDPRIKMVSQEGALPSVPIGESHLNFFIPLTPFDLLVDYALFSLANAIQTSGLAEVIHADYDLIDEHDDRRPVVSKGALSGASCHHHTPVAAYRLSAILRHDKAFADERWPAALASLKMTDQAAGVAAVHLPYVLSHRRLRDPTSPMPSSLAVREPVLQWPPVQAMPWFEIGETVSD